MIDHEGVPCTNRHERGPVPRIKIAFPERSIYSVEIPLRISDINYGGHLGNDAVLSIAQEARIAFLRSRGWTEQDIAGTGIIMTDAAVQYIAEAFHGDVLLVDVAIVDIQPLGCDFLFRMVKKGSGREVARVKTGIVFLDYASRKTRPVPPEFLRAVGLQAPVKPVT